MRLDRFLSESTEMTRGLAKRALLRGEVTVNGQLEKKAARHVQSDDCVTWLGEALEPVGLRYIMLNKPGGVECTARRELYPRVVDLLDVAKPERLHSVGRLDVDSTGLILITDDGQWSHRITAPSRHCPKVYRATLARPLEGAGAQRAIRAFAEGVELQGDKTPTLPARLECLDPYQVRLTIQEGRYHQVRRMLAAIGNHVEALHREAVGDLPLDETLAPGEWRELEASEVALF
ncbi:pseudouridine synthase [Halomonas sp. 18H]|uniref:pseudouridine synthase n=1 Tax=Halomonas almeriensis TaxID=308163 RepID=UPI0022325D2B|nr:MULTISPECIES: pseudouridine synthase [Halomonas]MCW4151932.1 pseudouridine synthase [Halomonas sp. 18H]MDN3554167.1 pseudouridine synthase [Halomonas almeriensis]